MVESGWQNPLVGGTVLRKPAIQSPNFVHSVTGWTINQDGSAEFNNLTVRGTFNGTNYIINSSGAFFYSGVPATGKLIYSITNASGTDPYGNTYPAGACSFAVAGGSGVDITIIDGTIYLGSHTNITISSAQMYNQSGSESLILTSAYTAGTTLPSLINLGSGTGTVSGTTTTPQVYIGDAVAPLTKPTDLVTTGNLYQVDTSLGGIVQWKQATLAAHITATQAGSGMIAGLWYRPTGASGLIAITGAGQINTAPFTSGSTVATGLPPSTTYRQMADMWWNSGTTFSPGLFLIDNTGTATYYGPTLAVGSPVYFGGQYPTAQI